MIAASAPAKLNLSFAVGGLRDDGYHSVVSLYQALDVWETVSVETSPDWTVSISGRVAADQLHMIPTDHSNLVVRAGLRLANHLDYQDPQPLNYQILKQVPVSAGLAGGSADAAAALLATDAIWCSGIPADVMAALASELGSDVPFSLLGGTALGTERGENLEPIPNDFVTNWVLIPELSGLSTPLVYQKLDRLRESAGLDPSGVATPQRPTELIEALQGGDLASVARHMHNDLEPAAIALMPSLATTIERATALGGLRAMVSGSGPTVAVLCESAETARALGENFPGSLVTRSTSDGSYLELGC